MLVHGMLEKAQLELTGSPAAETLVPLARMIADKTDPVNVRPYFWNGTSWKEFQFVTASAGIIQQNSGTACTVNWANGLVQRVVLTDNCIISFSNPQANQEHTLIVSQSSNTQYPGTPYSYFLNIQDQDTQQKSWQTKEVLNVNYNDQYVWIYRAGITGPLSTFIPSARPMVTGVASIGIGLSADGKTLGLGAASTPFFSYYVISKTPGKPEALFSARNPIIAPTAAAGAIKDVVYSKNGQMIYTAAAITPFVQAWTANSLNYIGTNAITNPATLPAGAAQCLGMHPNDLYLAVGHTTSPFVSVYQLNPGTGSAAPMGTKVSDPLTLPAAQVNAAKFSPFGDYLAVASQTSPFLQAYSFTTGFVAIAANPGTLPAGGPQPDKGGDGIAWHPTGNYIAMSMSVTPYIYVIPFNRATGTFGAPISFTDTANASTGGNVGVAWSPCGRWLYTCGTGGTFSVFACVYDFSAFTLGAATQAISSVATSISPTGIEVDPSGDCVYLALAGTDGVMSLAVPTITKNYLRTR